MTHLWVSVSLVANRGEYEAAEWRREALIDLRTLIEQTWPLGRSEVTGFGVKLKIG